jgi:UDP-glucose 4-epimerase
MRVAVIGSSGFVGRHVVRRLLAAGAEVFAIDVRAPSDPQPNEQVLVASVLEEGAAERLAATLGALDAVVWLAATIRQRTGVDDAALEDLALMVEAPLRLMRALTPAPPSFINVSSVQVYGRPVALPVDEEHPKTPFTAYGVAKLYSEQVLDFAAQKRGIAVASLRVAFVYGPGQHEKNALPQFIKKVKAGEAPVLHGSGRDVRDDVYVDDVARSIELAIARRARGAFNVSSGKPNTIGEVAEAVCALKVGAAQGSPGLTPRHDDEPSKWVDRWYSGERAKAAFGYEATTSLAAGVKATWDADER